MEAFGEMAFADKEAGVPLPTSFTRSGISTPAQRFFGFVYWG